MWLSKLVINTHCPQARNDLGSPYNIHRTIMSAFPTPLPKNERVLFRIENVTSDNQPVILVQSFHKPDWVAIQFKFTGYFAQQPVEKKVDSIKIQNGQIYRFRLRANPSKRVFYQNTNKSQRISLFTENARKEWLMRKAENCGFELLADSIVIRDAPYRMFFIPKEEKTHKAILNIVDYDGLLKIINPILFLDSVWRGIGPAKAWGCGLLSFA